MSERDVKQIITRINIKLPLERRVGTCRMAGAQGSELWVRLPREGMWELRSEG